MTQTGKLTLLVAMALCVWLTTAGSEASAATDDLDTISGGVDGDIIILSTVNSGRDVVVKHATGNIQCGSDRTLNSVADIITLLKSGSNWLMISFANN